MNCGHHLAERIMDLEPVWVEDIYSLAEVYFCDECGVDFACIVGTNRIISPLSMRDIPADETGSGAADEV